MEKNSLFYMANLYPEIGRMFSYYDSGKKEAGDNAKKRALNIVDTILTFRDIKPAGREEWSVIKNFILGFDELDSFEKTILEKYSEPFSYKFMNQYTLS
ncbi:MAG: hypothetical protein UR85_C0009G0025 [Candidatus Nomurabacteria bacterium GW2011_GWF2_35_66]|uniref:Uncharacterized protein n=1 Tax=Candidatus Nomurabacteria bacterium GW2011_GWE1_35_16 TaxID=1618761 RepID=A0A0G0B9G2_9BACT|nr:MAG: hypothetical protein UR55_C0014G0025 [Candidatus Nomurabacteria bacterium GW2011_GWF1_34_20]KKP62092.1 MAG: hypothetical protein UR57_C0013G0017 [Candidatus Nomurabacteria bacterium GW2011_GWE2_34_25]KKP66058.1 MAG: hypothetical protein UR64_C0013G0017 [Candidatus Nomurabacteria bacterium GW2011_GWE1_35_16]KKP83036.1 MAG: hypothetical protein UR85_C0009G0025 [Candidatus Nomurabacteria bacterium GW2011_GWF2_35_66]HAE36966.1 hypothetical protein [Candidatus Nomurabacteria bacterium]